MAGPLSDDNQEAAFFLEVQDADTCHERRSAGYFSVSIDCLILADADHSKENR